MAATHVEAKGAAKGAVKGAAKGAAKASVSAPPPAVAATPAPVLADCLFGGGGGQGEGKEGGQDGPKTTEEKDQLHIDVMRDLAVTPDEVRWIPWADRGPTGGRQGPTGSTC